MLLLKRIDKVSSASGCGSSGTGAVSFSASVRTRIQIHDKQSHSPSRSLNLFICRGLRNTKLLPSKSRFAHVLVKRKNTFLAYVMNKWVTTYVLASNVGKIKYILRNYIPT